MPQCTSLAEVVLSRASTGDAPVYVAWKCSSWPDDVRGGGCLVQSSSPIVLVAPTSVVRRRGVLSKPIGMFVYRLRRLR
ncbi:hypothetical protein CRG98_046157 [Punica granatum]|uniref:Uncharacterized protein n=1 Tax=Punica granatum TaxID=22663 RepID=A0A2I0HPG0_PUNGR|nr:hypothetical protein CRG98_046157 [Punica granatum]